MEYNKIKTHKKQPILKLKVEQHKNGNLINFECKFKANLSFKL